VLEPSFHSRRKAADGGTVDASAAGTRQIDGEAGLLGPSEDTEDALVALVLRLPRLLELPLSLYSPPPIIFFIPSFFDSSDSLTN
jgi:hypothetical protein